MKLFKKESGIVINVLIYFAISLLTLIPLIFVFNVLQAFAVILFVEGFACAHLWLWFKVCKKLDL